LTGATTNIGDVLYIVTRSDANTNLFTNQFVNAAQDSIVSFGNMSGQITYTANWDLNTPGNRSFTGGNDVAILVTVPEPTTASLLLLGGAAMLGRRRRRVK
ncbi:MAG TPA: PEP-CTERM sorting domain-containing protein, partial [Roseimicrobium sp.]|nr:PEP-CTERM sorting domain-containing protein [Roseimicrobium sp.]